MELKPDYIRALNVAFGEAKLPAAVEERRSWAATRDLIEGYLPRGFRPGEERPPAEPRAGEFADLYFRSGYSLEETKAMLGKGEGTPRGLNVSLHYRIADALGITVKEAGVLLTQFRADKACDLWRPWHDSVQSWIAGGPKPAPYSVNFHEGFHHAASLFERLNFPWRYLVRDTKGPLTLSAARKFENVFTEEHQPFLIEVRDGEKLLNVYCVADALRQPFVPRIENWRAILGPAGHFSRLLVGDGPVCLKTAFEPRPVRLLRQPDRTDKVAFLLAEGRCESSHIIYVPNEFLGNLVRPFVSPSSLRSGSACRDFDLFAVHASEANDSVSMPIATYTVSSRDRMIVKVELEQHLGHLASWEKQGARQLDAIHVKRWLRGESDVVPRLEPLKINEGVVWEGSEPTDRTRKFVNLCKQKLPVPKAYQGEMVLPRLTEIDGRRLLELYSYPGNPVLLKSMKLSEGTLKVSSPLGL